MSWVRYITTFLSIHYHTINPCKTNPNIWFGPTVSDSATAAWCPDACTQGTSRASGKKGGIIVIMKDGAES